MLKKCLLMAFVAGCSFMGTYACAATQNPQIKKLYVGQHSVKILKDGFSIDTSKGFIKARKLRSDGNGIYILKRDIMNPKGWFINTHTHRDRDSDDTAAECPVCHRWCKNKREMMNHTCYRRRHK